MNIENRLFTDKEASEYLRLSQVSLWRLRRKGVISFRRVASRVLYTSADLDEYLERNKRAALGKEVNQNA